VATGFELDQVDHLSHRHLELRVKLWNNLVCPGFQKFHHDISGGLSLALDAYNYLCIRINQSQIRLKEFPGQNVSIRPWEI